MPDHVAFLRAVNLGRHRRVSGAELGSLFEGMGFREASAFRTSGNVAFRGTGEPGMKERIEAGLEEALGYEVPVFLRTDEEMRAIAAHEPFDPTTLEAVKGKLQVLLLGGRPGEEARERVLELATDRDRLVFGAGKELFWLPGEGVQGSELDLKAVERLLGASTIRTMGTVRQMAAKFFAG